MNFILFFLSFIIPVFSIYDKFINSDTNIYINKFKENPFYSSKQLYSSHYSNILSKNITNNITLR